MKYRTFGKTGLRVSALGFGLMRLPFLGQDMSQIDEEQAMEMALLAIDHGVNIPRNFQLFNDHYVFHDPSAMMRYQDLLGDSEKASNCVQCGQCEEHCPQRIPIPVELEQVAELF